VSWVEAGHLCPYPVPGIGPSIGELEEQTCHRERVTYGGLGACPERISAADFGRAGGGRRSPAPRSAGPASDGGAAGRCGGQFASHHTYVPPSAGDPGRGAIKLLELCCDCLSFRLLITVAGERRRSSASFSSLSGAASENPEQNASDSDTRGSMVARLRRQTARPSPAQGYRSRIWRARRLQNSPWAFDKSTGKADACAGCESSRLLRLAALEIDQ
jgi:hypothetical protein